MCLKRDQGSRYRERCRDSMTAVNTIAIVHQQLARGYAVQPLLQNRHRIGQRVQSLVSDQPQDSVLAVTGW